MELLYYSGRAGLAWITTDRAHVFRYATYQAARLAAERHNIALHGSGSRRWQYARARKGERAMTLKTLQM